MCVFPILLSVFLALTVGQCSLAMFKFAHQDVDAANHIVAVHALYERWVRFVWREWGHDKVCCVEGWGIKHTLCAANIWTGHKCHSDVVFVLSVCTVSSLSCKLSCGKSLLSYKLCLTGLLQCVRLWMSVYQFILITIGLCLCPYVSVCLCVCVHRLQWHVVC